ncbi:unnamed protein product [Periconia digitata]|uniref:Uncharacterized protein n=1 Tax=Periconia digitata TaxID=1303443 RepID=A0A9W4XD76_9PLEO|nr:unnamed protein product [Periconia digitata]
MSIPGQEQSYWDIETIYTTRWHRNLARGKSIKPTMGDLCCLPQRSTLPND